MSGRDSAHKLVWLDRAGDLDAYFKEEGTGTINDLDVHGNTALVRQGCRMLSVLTYSVLAPGADA